METLNNKNCEFKDNVIDYCEGLLADEDARAIEAHLDICNECKKTLRDHKAFCEALEACNTDIPAELHESIMRAVKRESLRTRFLRAAKRYAAPVAAAILLVVAVPAVIKNGANEVDTAAHYSANGDSVTEIAMVVDGKGRLGEPTEGVKTEEDHEFAPADTWADIVVEPSAEAQDATLEAYQYVVESGEVVTCYLCPIVWVSADEAKTLAQNYAALVVQSDDSGAVFKTDRELLKALAKLATGVPNVDRADFIRVNVK
jgi:hypothetical protein